MNADTRTVMIHYLQRLDRSSRFWVCSDSRDDSARLPLAVSKVLRCEPRDEAILAAWREVCAESVACDERAATARR